MTTTIASDRWRRALEPLAAATAFAIATGLLHVVVVWIRRYGLHQFTWTSREIIWMAPLAYLPWFLGPAILLVLVGLVRRAPSAYAVTFVNVFLMALALLLLFPRIDQWASVVLAAGCAVQLARIASRRPVAWCRRYAMAIPVLVSVTTVLAVGFRVARGATERRMLAEFPAADAGAPNVLLLVLDTVRAASLDLYGYARATSPHLTEWARQGVTFDYAIATAPWSLPSHASLFTGRPASELSSSFLEPVRLGPASLAEVMREAGYATGGFVANSYYTHTESGLEAGFAHYDDYPVTLRQVVWNSTFAQSGLFRGLYFGAIRDRSPAKALAALRRFRLASDVRYPSNDPKRVTDVNDEFLRWQAGIARRPFFAFLNYFDAHDYSPSPAFARRFSDHPDTRDKYDAAVAYIDAEIDSLFRTLERRGILDHTIVIITSDHGEQFGEHGLEEHGNSVYTQLLRVPLVIRYPGAVPAGVRVPGVASLRNIPATVLDLSRVRTAKRFPGETLRDFWEDRRPDSLARPGSLLRETDAVTGRQTVHLSVIDDSLHFTWKRIEPGPREKPGDVPRELVAEQLFRYRTDSTESEDLRRSAQGRAVAERYRALLPQRSTDGPLVRSDQPNP